MYVIEGDERAADVEVGGPTGRRGQGGGDGAGSPGDGSRRGGGWESGRLMNRFGL